MSSLGDVLSKTPQCPPFHVPVRGVSTSVVCVPSWATKPSSHLMAGRRRRIHGYKEHTLRRESVILSAIDSVYTDSASSRNSSVAYSASLCVRASAACSCCRKIQLSYVTATREKGSFASVFLTHGFTLSLTLPITIESLMRFPYLCAFLSRFSLVVSLSSHFLNGCVFSPARLRMR